MSTPDTRAAEIAALLSRLAELLGERPEPTPDKPTRPMPKRVLLTPEEAADALGVGRTTVYALLKSGDLESIQIGRLRRIPTDCLAPCVARLSDNQSDPAA